MNSVSDFFRNHSGAFVDSGSSSSHSPDNPLKPFPDRAQEMMTIRRNLKIDKSLIRRRLSWLVTSLSTAATNGPTVYSDRVKEDDDDDDDDDNDKCSTNPPRCSPSSSQGNNNSRFFVPTARMTQQGASGINTPPQPPKTPHAPQNLPNRRNPLVENHHDGQDVQVIIQRMKEEPRVEMSKESIDQMRTVGDMGEAVGGGGGGGWGETDQIKDLQPSRRILKVVHSFLIPPPPLPLLPIPDPDRPHQTSPPATSSSTLT